MRVQETQIVRTLIKLIIFLTVGMSIQERCFASDSPIGYWKTIDDVSGKPKAIVQIYKSTPETLSGRIRKIFPRPGYDQNELCRACNGEKHNQPIVGMVILEGLNQDAKHPNQWSNGKILDPNNGKIYHCTIQVTNKGEHLKVRGYIGIPLFGRSQTWVRYDQPNK